MKKNILIVALATLTLAFAACQKEEISNPINTNPNGGSQPGDYSGLRVKSVADLIGTGWSYSLFMGDSATFAELGDCMDSADIIEMLTFEFGLNFDTDYAHLTFPDNVIGLNVVDNGTDYTVQEISQMDYTYTYDPATLSGTLSGGNLDDLVIPFTYNTATDEITVVLTVEEDDNSTSTFPLVFSRVQ